MSMPESQDQRQKERPPITQVLTEGQRRSLSLLLRRVERVGWQVEEQMQQAGPADLTLTHFTQMPDPSQRAMLLQLAQALRQKAVQLALDCGFEGEEESCLRTLHAQFTVLWTDLEEARPDKLRRYGALHPLAEGRLGPRIQELIELVLALDGVVSGARHASQGLPSTDHQIEAR
jgi:hypothetical protein